MSRPKISGLQSNACPALSSVDFFDSLGIPGAVGLEFRFDTRAIPEMIHGGTSAYAL